MRDKQWEDQHPERVTKDADHEIKNTHTTIRGRLRSTGHFCGVTELRELPPFPSLRAQKKEKKKKRSHLSDFMFMLCVYV